MSEAERHRRGTDPSGEPAKEPPDAANERAGTASVPVILAVRDLFFRVKLETALRRLGVSWRLLRSVDTPRDLATDRPTLVIVDLSDGSFDALDLVRGLRGEPELTTLRVLGFASHGDRDLQKAAREAGCDLVVARSRMAADLPRLLSSLLPGTGANAG